MEDLGGLFLIYLVAAGLILIMHAGSQGVWLRLSGLILKETLAGAGFEQHESRICKRRWSAQISEISQKALAPLRVVPDRPSDVKSPSPPSMSERTMKLAKQRTMGRFPDLTELSLPSGDPAAKSPLLHVPPPGSPSPIAGVVHGHHRHRHRHQEASSASIHALTQANHALTQAIGDLQKQVQAIAQHTGTVGERSDLAIESESSVTLDSLSLMMPAVAVAKTCAHVASSAASQQASNVTSIMREKVGTAGSPVCRVHPASSWARRSRLGVRSLPQTPGGSGGWA